MHGRDLISMDKYYKMISSKVKNPQLATHHNHIASQTE